jgi:hypothetical protein
MPHGKVVLFPTIMLTIAAILSMLVLCNCRFVEAGNSSYSYSYDIAGIWAGCVSSSYYSNNYMSFSVHQNDGARKAAMSFGLIACIVGVTAMIGLWPITCRPYSRMWINIIGVTIILACCSQLATLSMLGTEYCQAFGCRLGWGGIMSIIAAILWLISAIGVFLIPKPVESTPTTRQTAGEMINITETIQLDGTKVTEKVTTSPDGTKTIERTIEKNGVEQPVHGESIAHAIVMKADEP